MKIVLTAAPPTAPVDPKPPVAESKPDIRTTPAQTPAAAQTPAPAERPAKAPAPAEAAPADIPAPAPKAPIAAAEVTLQQVKDAWPEVLEAVQKAKRTAWMVVFTAKPLELREGGIGQLLRAQVANHA